MISTYRLLLTTLSTALVALSAQGAATSDITHNNAKSHLNTVVETTAPKVDYKTLAEATPSTVVVKKGPIDNRTYHYFTLSNQLRVLLVSDPDTDKAAASLDVHVGSSDDPRDREGLAHFLEHMLFLGTAKYPDAAEYQAFISANGGSHNAYTSAEHTNYFFDVDAKQLEPALDRFSQFFIAPLFDEVYVDRERNAVHSEYQAKIKDDSRRGYDVYRSLLNQQHPYAKFSVGSLTTLADRPNDKVRDDLLAFYAEHYSSDEMTLVVLGKQNIAQLKAMVEQRFGLVPQKPSVNVTSKTSEAASVAEVGKFIPLFADDTLPMEVVSKPVKETRQMTMVFPLPSVKKYYAEKPFNFLGHILGHEGKGSLLSVLKAKGWAEGLSAGGNETGANNAAFNISITLTEVGIQQREQVRALVFHALDVLRKKGVQEWRYAEEQQLAKVAFQFRENARAINTVSTLANNLHDYPAAEVISADYLYQQFDAKLIKSYLSKMTPDNLYVTTVFPEAKTDKTTHYYQVPYAVKRLSTKSVKIPRSLKKQYHLPEKNIFIPENIALFPADKSLANEPLLATSDNQQVWSRQDLSFGVPKASLSIRVKSPIVSQSASHSAMNQFLLAMIRDRLNEQSYPAIIAGVNFSFSPNSRGFDINVQGYHDKIDVLLEMIMKEIKQPILEQERFNNIKVELLRSLSNSSKQTPFRQLMKQVPVNVFEPYWADAELVKPLEAVTLKQLKQFTQQWRQAASTQALFYGNIDTGTVNRWREAISELPQQVSANNTAAALAPAEVIKLTPKQTQQFSLSVDHNDKAVGLYVQGTTDTLEDQAKMVLLRQVLESSFYTQLRTEQQLGYIVFLTSMTLKDVPGSLFMVQSPSTSVQQVKQAMTAFVQQSFAKLPDDISIYQQSAATKLLEKPQQLSAQASRYWQNILRDDTSFSYRQRLVDLIHQVSAQQLKDYYQQVLLEQQRLLWLVADKEANTSVEPLFSADQAKYQYP